MIHIEQDQQLKDEPQMRVAVPTGDYNETDLIECYKDGEDPNTPTAMYQAQFIGLGRNIYHQSEELTEDQLNALMANVPADGVINNRKMMDGKRPASKYVGRIIQRKGRVMKRELRTDAVAETQQATTTQPVVSKPITTDTSTSTPSTATSTPVDTSTATTTPVDTSTSTPAFVSTSTPSDISTTTATTTPDFSADTSSTTPDTITSTTTDDSIISTSTPVIEDSSTTTPIEQPADTTSTSSEIVAFAKGYAKKKILKRLNL